MSGKLANLCELHCHLDGSLRAETFLELLSAAKLETDAAAVDIGGAGGDGVPAADADALTFETVDDVRTKLAFQDGWDLPRCLQSFAYTLMVLQSAENLERVACECACDCADDGCSYAEIRYCPSLHRSGGLGDAAIVAAVAAGLRKAAAERPGATFKQIITCLRDFGPEEALVMTKLAVASPKEDLVVGVDLAGNEVTTMLVLLLVLLLLVLTRALPLQFAHPPAKFVAAFEYAFENGMAITIHAGEGPTDTTTQHVKDAVELLHAVRTDPCCSSLKQSPLFILK